MLDLAGPPRACGNLRVIDRLDFRAEAGGILGISAPTAPANRWRPAAKCWRINGRKSALNGRRDHSAPAPHPRTHLSRIHRRALWRELQEALDAGHAPPGPSTNVQAALPREIRSALPIGRGRLRWPG